LESYLWSSGRASYKVLLTITFSQNYYFIDQESQLAKLEAKLFSNKQTTTTLAVRGYTSVGLSGYTLVHWNPMERYRTLWNPIDPHGTLQNLAEPYRRLWNIAESSSC
jgi:hypothetical protein